RFIDHNTQDAQYDEAGLSAPHIVATALNALGVSATGIGDMLEATLSNRATGTKS
ncbi:hypothetical protein HNR55_002670, partial [Acetobacter lovaniensis]|nr:hypothetical protein [Acetobacter lovaniensis]